MEGIVILASYKFHFIKVNENQVQHPSNNKSTNGVAMHKTDSHLLGSSEGFCPLVQLLFQGTYY